MSLVTRLSDLATAIATDIKQHRTWITGSSSGNLTGLTTTVKTDLVSAINEVKAGSAGAPPSATTTAQGVVELATLAEMATGTDTTRVATVEGVRQERLALKAEILGGAGPAYDTLAELQQLVIDAEESGTIAALATTVAGKADAADVYTKAELGNPETDLAAAYAAAKA